VIGHSSAYKGTPESQSATKKPHKMEKSADKIGGFLLYMNEKQKNFRYF